MGGVRRFGLLKERLIGELVGHVVLLAARECRNNRWRKQEAKQFCFQNMKRTAAKTQTLIFYLKCGKSNKDTVNEVGNDINFILLLETIKIN